MHQRQTHGKPHAVRKVCFKLCIMVVCQRVDAGSTDMRMSFPFVTGGVSTGVGGYVIGIFCVLSFSGISIKLLFLQTQSIKFPAAQTTSTTICADNSSTLICGQQVSSYAQGGSYGPQAGIRQCAKTKAILLWAVSNGHRPDHPQSWQNILEWCNYNHGEEFLNIVGKRLVKTVWYFWKMAANQQLNQDSFGSSIDGIAEAEAWLARQKSLNDVEMKDADAVVKTDNKSQVSTSSRRRTKVHRRNRPSRSSDAATSSVGSCTSETRHSAQGSDKREALERSWEILWDQANRDAGQGQDYKFRRLLLMEEAIQSMKIEIDRLQRENAFGL
ncbi:hypothetical protein FNAPI_13439 [Fusarium napiforme]|uniref:Uncharacterized protein n=1 Tax=Fusarium napiforme TaxID=42672 RepID=A0A8H5IAL5_9HYPO|nr:hypothetical protein FNAPI_13439 [Fusarium napiforme]